MNRTLILAGSVCAAILIAATVFVQTAPEPRDESFTAKPLLKLAAQHAEISGSLENCGRISGDDVRRTHAELIAAWAYPGWYHQYFGNRLAYQRSVMNDLTRSFLRGGQEECPGLVGHYEFLLHQIDSEIVKATKSD